MSNRKEDVKFEKYRKNILDLYAPTGELLAYGYIRKFNDNKAIDIPAEISFVCSQFLGLYLEYESSLTSVIENENDKNVTLKLNNCKEWDTMSYFNKRLLRDQLIFDLNKEISQIECEVKSKQFGQNGIEWISPILKNGKNLCYINLSNCYLNDGAVKIICRSIQQNPNLKPLKWLDMSDNINITDKCMDYILSIMDRLNGFNLNCTGITDISCVLLSDYLNENDKICDTFRMAKMDDNKGITESGKLALRPFSSQLTIILD